MGRKLEEIEIREMKKAVIVAEQENKEHSFKIKLKQLQIDEGLDANYAEKKRELTHEITNLKGRLTFNNTLIDKYSQCIETGEVEIDVKEDLDTGNN